jgi:hypothetical protein
MTMKPAILLLLSGLLITLAQPAIADDWSVIDSPILVRGEVRNIVPERTQVEVMQRWIEWRIDNVLPRIMEEQDVDVWILLRHREPAYLSLVEANAEGMVLRRPRILLIRLAGDQVERIELSELEELKTTLKGLKPTTLAVSEGDRESVEEFIPKSLRSRLQNSELLEVGFLQEQAPAAISVFEHVTRVANEIYAEAFSNIAITPDVTTSDDLNWWMRDRYKALGLETYDHPTITVQRSHDDRKLYGDPDGAFQIAGPPRNGFDVVLRRGDLVFADTGIKYFGLNTDAQQCVYLLRSGETEMPKGLQHAFANARRLQDLVMEEIRPSRSGAEVFDAAMTRADDERLRADIYSHPLPLYLDRYELNGGFIYLERYGAGPEIARGDKPELDLPIGRNTVYALELDVLYSVPEWGGQDIRILMETNIAVTDTDARFIGGRQSSCYLVH